MRKVMLLCILLAGCQKDGPSYHYDAELRAEKFTECMELAAKIGQGQAKYNDLSEVADSCGNTSYYIAHKCVANCTPSK